MRFIPSCRFHFCGIYSCLQDLQAISVHGQGNFDPPHPNTIQTELETVPGCLSETVVILYLLLSYTISATRIGFWKDN